MAHSLETKQKISESVKKRNKQEKINLGISLDSKVKRRPHSKKTIEKMRETLKRLYADRTKTKEKYYLGKIIRDTFEYKNWRRKIFHRDDYSCKECTARGVRLQVHHIKSMRQIIKENNLLTKEDSLKCLGLWDTENGITLCLGCHRKTDSFCRRV